MSRRELPWQVFTEAEDVPFNELADEAMRVARHGMGLGPTSILTRLAFWSLGRDLRRVHKWAHMAQQPLWYRAWHLGVLHYGFWIFAPVAALTFLRYLLLPADETAADLIYTLGAIAGISASFGIAWALFHLAGIDSEVASAVRYRESRLAIEWRLRSKEGFQGLKAVRSADGGWLLEVEEPTSTDE